MSRLDVRICLLVVLFYALFVAFGVIGLSQTSRERPQGRSLCPRELAVDKGVYTYEGIWIERNFNQRIVEDGGEWRERDIECARDGQEVVILSVQGAEWLRKFAEN